MTKQKQGKNKKVLIIGSGFGGLALGIRLQAMGYQTKILEKLDKPGGRAYLHEAEGFKFDMGPTVITVPHFIDELFELGGKKKEDYLKLVPIKPFYRIYFDDKSVFDYDGNKENTLKQIEKFEPEDVEGYHRFEKSAGKIFQKGFLELGFTYFGNLWTMLKVVPDLVVLGAIPNLFSFVSKYFKNDKLRQVFSFETLLIGGSPFRVPAIYSMVHFVEKTWGIFYAMGGTGSLVQAFVKLYEEMGGELILNSEVTKINLVVKKATGVEIVDGRTLEADVVVSNADYATTYMNLIDSRKRFWNSDWKIKSMAYSMSLVVIYFGFKKTADLDLKHHNIILGPRYKGLLDDIFNKKVLSEDFSQYLHVPTLTDPSMAPEGHHTAYTLIPVPNKLAKGVDWDVEGDKITDKVLKFLDEEGYIPDLQKNIVYKKFVTPDYFENTLNSYLGNGFGVEPVLTQSAYFRPHNKSEDISNLYLVGANTQPGAGTPSVMMSAKMTAELIEEFEA
jgi:phytoene desaturase